MAKNDVHRGEEIMTSTGKGFALAGMFLCAVIPLLLVAPTHCVYALEAGFGVAVLVAVYRLMRMDGRSENAGIVLVAFTLIMLSKESRTLGHMPLWHARYLGVSAREAQIWLAANASVVSVVLTLTAFLMLCFTWSGLKVDGLIYHGWRPFAVGLIGAGAAYVVMIGLNYGISIL